MSGTSLRERRWLIPTVIAVLFAVGALSGSADAGRADNRKADVTINGAQAAPDELLVKFGPGLASNALAAIQANTGIQVLKARPFRLIDWYYVQVKSPRALGETIKAFRASPNVVAVEPNYTVHAMAVPNDPMWGTLWGMTQIGAPAAWDVRTESEVLVAVIDTGVAHTHADLALNMWTNPGEVAGDGLDNDYNGFVDDVHGWDFYDNDSDPTDANGHGTHVAGTIGAVGNNATGVAGVCWRVKIMAVRFLGPDGTGHVVDSIDAIEYATLNGAKIMNNSWGGGAYSKAVEDVIRIADGFGALFVAAAGNTNTNNDAAPVYPANYQVPGVISVAASGTDDALWVDEEGVSGSNYGPATVHLAAPGASIRSTVPGNDYAYMTGTSMAAPHVSGACALLWAQYPWLTHMELKNLILVSALKPNIEEPDDDPETVNPLAGLLVTEGRLDLASAMSELRIVTLSPLRSGELYYLYSVTMRAIGGVPPYTWALVDPPEGFWLTIDPDTGELSGTPSDPANVADYEITVSVTDSSVEPVTVQGVFAFSIDDGLHLTVLSDPFSNVEIKGSAYGTTEYVLTFPRPDPWASWASVLAPAQWADRYFYEWRVNGAHETYSRSTSIEVDTNKTAVAVYDPLKNFYVNDGTSENGISPGNDANSGLSPSTPKRHVQAMLDAIAAGSYACHEWRLIVSAGTYQENVLIGPEHSGLTLQGLGWDTTVIDGGGNGPCIHADRWMDGTIVGLRITNGDSQTGGGGMLFSNGCSALIIRNKIFENTAVEGGAIASYSSTITVKDNYIEDNVAATQGGAILVVEGHAVIIEGNSISGNTASMGGGIRGWLSTGWITTNTIIGNAAPGGYGGGIFLTGSGFQVDQNVISGNSAARGGGIFCWASSEPIQMNSVTGNTATLTGGGISCEYFCTHQIQDNVVSSNAAQYGGGVYLSDSEPVAFFGNSITGNTAGASGGGICLSGRSSPRIGTDNLLDAANHISSNVAAEDGGGIYVSQGGSPSVGLLTPFPWPRSNYLDGNVAGRFGGAMYCAPSSQPTVLNNSVWDCVAVAGGGMYFDDSEASVGDGSIPGMNSFSGNVVTTYGGGVCITGETMPTLDFNDLFTNTADEGGGIYCADGTDPTIISTFVAYNAANYGGGLRCVAASPTMSGILDVEGNIAHVKGGGIYITEESVLTAAGLHLYANVAPEGPGLYCVDSTADIDVSTIEAHACGLPGAGIRALNSTVTLVDSLILNNSVLANGGGGVYVAEGSVLTMTGTTIQHNSALEGGGIYVADAVATVQTIEQGPYNNVVQNTATRGAGIYCSADASLVIQKTRFGEGYAEQGAGIYCASGATPTIENCLFIGSSANQGAGIYCAADSLPMLKNLTAVANVATAGGAGVHSENPAVSLRNSVFWLNNEDVYGVSATYSCIPNPPPGTGNFGADPLMVGPVYSGTWDESPSEEYCGGFWVPIGVTIFTEIPDGVAGDQFVGMWLNPNIKSNIQFQIVPNPFPDMGAAIAVKGDATLMAEEGGQFQIWDYHEKSTGGHWTGAGWVADTVTSPCIDTGNPADNYSQEPEDNGDRINMGAYGNTYQASLSAARVPYLLAEAGTVWIDHNWKTVELTEDFIDPVVVVGPATSVGWQPGVVRVRNVTNESFELRFQEWNYLDGWHCLEAVQWLAVERGVFDLAGGGKLIAGSFSTNVTNVYAPYAVTFAEPFLSVPVVVAQVMTYDGVGAVTDRICGVTTDGMTFAMQEEEGSLDGGVHTTETIGYIAVTQNAKAIGTIACDVRSTAAIVTHLPTMLSSSKGSVLVRVREEQSKDSETLHWTAEKVGFIGIAGQPPVVADMQTCNGSDPCNLRVTLLAQSFQFEDGVVSANSSWQTVSLANVYRDPVVLVGPATYAGSDPGVERVRNVTSGSFDVRFQEWNYLDGSHSWEKMYYLVAERGAWQIEANKLLVADELQTSNDNVYAPTTVYMPMPFVVAPVVVATQQTAAGTDAVTERLKSVGTATFAVALQEQEAGGGHVTETVGYVGIGSGLGGVPALGSITVTAASQDTIGGEVGLTGWRIFITEEQSKDSETTHGEEKVGWFAFAYSASEPYFLADMQTIVGTDPATLRCAQLVKPASRSGGPATALGLAGAPVNLGLSPGADCALDVSAADATGRQLEGVQVVVDRDGREAVQATPWVEECKAGDSVKLTAPDSVVENGTVLSFQEWEVDGEVSLPGVTSVSVEIAGRHRAVAVYVSVGPASGPE